MKIVQGQSTINLGICIDLNQEKITLIEAPNIQ